MDQRENIIITGKLTISKPIVSWTFRHYLITAKFENCINIHNIYNPFLTVGKRNLHLSIIKLSACQFVNELKQFLWIKCNSLQLYSHYAHQRGRPRRQRPSATARPPQATATTNAATTTTNNTTTTADTRTSTTTTTANGLRILPTGTGRARGRGQCNKATKHQTEDRPTMQFLQRITKGNNQLYHITITLT